MAITLGVHASAGSTNGNTAVTAARNVASGTTLIACVAWGPENAGDATLADNAGNTYVKIGNTLGPNTGGYGNRGMMFKCENCTGNAALVLTATRTTAFPSVAYQAILGTSPVVEAIANGVVDTVSPYTAAAVTPAANGAAILSGFAQNGSGTTSATAGPSPLTLVEEVSDTNSFYPVHLAAGVQTTAAAITASWTCTGGPGSGFAWTVAVSESGGTSYTLTADGGSFALTGAAAGTLFGRRLSADSGSFALTGADATLTYVAGYTLDAAAGSFALTGAAATLARGRRVTADAGSFALSGGADAPSLGSHTLEWDFEGSGSDPHSSDPITTVSGSTLIVPVLVANALDVAPTDNYGNTFTRYGSRINYTEWSGYGLSVWRATNITGGTGHVVTVQKDIAPTAEITMNVIEVRGSTSMTGSVSEELINQPLITAPVTTSGPSLLLSLWSGDSSAGPMTAVAQDGFTPLDSALDEVSNWIQYASAYKVETEPLTGYDVEWLETPNQGALLGLFAFEGGSGETGFLVDRVLSAESGTFALTGTDASLQYDPIGSYSISAEAGTYMVSGSEANLIASLRIGADSAAYVLSGSAAELLSGKSLSSEAGSYALTGSEASLLYNPAGTYSIAANAGTFTLSGSDVSWPRTYNVNAQFGAFVFTGAPAGLLYSEDSSGADVIPRQVEVSSVILLEVRL